MAVIPSFMCIAAALYDVPGKSFEEVRFEDYLKSYSTTGRPPPPCPPQPTDEHQRRLLNLPPLFKPVPEPSTSNTSPESSSSSTVVPTRPTNPAELPDAQGFSTTTHSAEVYHSISTLPLFSRFSFEELRYYAYLSGNRVPPPSVQMSPFVQEPPLPSLDSTASSGAMTSGPGPDVPSSRSEIMQSISCQPAFAGHSFEELRVAYLLGGRERNSSEIFATVARTEALVPVSPPLQPLPSLFSKPNVMRLI